jgi:hypothetical protein
LFGLCVSADAATLFTAFGVFGFESSLDALLATDFDVFSLLAILIPSRERVCRTHFTPWRSKSKDLAV